MSRRCRAIAVGAVLAALVPGCTRTCADGLKSDGRYRATLIETWREGGGFRFDPRSMEVGAVGCEAFDDLKDGTTIDLVGTGEVGSGECNDVIARVEKAPARVGLVLHRGGGEGFMAATHEVSIGDCKGFWSLGFRAVGSANVFAEPKRGELPPIVLTRIFQPMTESAACKRCSDTFVAKLEKR